MGVYSGNLAVLLVLAISTATLLAPASPAAAPAAPSCGDVDRAVSPCLGYLTGRAWRPPFHCCVGAASLRQMAATDANMLQAVCECLRGLGSRILGLDQARAARLPILCGLGYFNMPLSPNANCSSSIETMN